MNFVLTLSTLQNKIIYICKQCRTRWDGSCRAVSSGFSLFAIQFRILNDTPICNNGHVQHQLEESTSATLVNGLTCGGFTINQTYSIFELAIFVLLNDKKNKSTSSPFIQLIFPWFGIHNINPRQINRINHFYHYYFFAFFQRLDHKFMPRWSKHIFDVFPKRIVPNRL